MSCRVYSRSDSDAPKPATLPSIGNHPNQPISATHHPTADTFGAPLNLRFPSPGQSKLLCTSKTKWWARVASDSCAEVIRAEYVCKGDTIPPITTCMKLGLTDLSLQGVLWFVGGDPRVCYMYRI